ncbi:uncharacterized protein [Physcomitrium patens]|uniref:uncharacterized protein n=1 Tax=Physcomitrium patens TaxID=3218 RepID=UPI003CCE1D3B
MGGLKANEAQYLLWVTEKGNKDEKFTGVEGAWGTTKGTGSCSDLSNKNRIHHYPPSGEIVWVGLDSRVPFTRPHKPRARVRERESERERGRGEKELLRLCSLARSLTYLLWLGPFTIWSSPPSLFLLHDLSLLLRLRESGDALCLVVYEDVGT